MHKANSTHRVEHRNGSRQPVDIKAVVEVGSAARTPGRLHDVSPGGVFVAVPTVSVSDDMPLRLRFTLRERGGRRCCSWRGVVVRCSTHGLGAAFESTDPQNIEGLLALLEAAENSSLTRRLLGG